MWKGEDIIIALYRRFVVYPGGAVVEEVAGVEDILSSFVFYINNLFYYLN